MTEKEILENQIKEATEKLKQLEEQEKISEKREAIKKLSEYTTEEKVAKFDSMYKSALGELKEVIRGGYHNDDYSQYAWESYMEIIARDHDKFWKYWDKINK